MNLPEQQRRAAVIAYLDAPSTLSEEMLLGCLVDCGFTVDEVERTVRALKPPATRWAVVAEPAHRGALRTMRVDVLAEGEGRAYTESDARPCMEQSDLPPRVRQRIVNCLHRLPSDGSSEGESPLIETVATLAAIVAGLDALGIEQLFSTTPATATPLANAVLAELATFEQPEMILTRIGVGAGAALSDDPRPSLARLWLGEPLTYDAG